LKQFLLVEEEWIKVMNMVAFLKVKVAAGFIIEFGQKTNQTLILIAIQKDDDISFK